MGHVERRGAVRIPAKLAMEIRLGDAEGRAKVHSLNVSANGVYFKTPKFIPVLTRLDITLDLPVDSEDEVPGETVVCSGVVVRTVPELETPGVPEYEIACYFTSIDEADRETLEAYILKQVAF